MYPEHILNNLIFFALSLGSLFYLSPIFLPNILVVGENQHGLFEYYRYDVYLPTSIDTRLEETMQDAENLGELELRSGGVYNFLIQKPLSNTTNTSVSTMQT